MRSLRTRITLMTVLILIVAVIIMSALSVLFIKNNQQRNSDQLMLLLCETGVSNLDYYFTGTQKSVEKVASYAEADLNGLSEDTLSEHVAHVREYFEKTADKTNGVLTYYYRIDPSVSDTVKGFWYTDIDGEGFSEHEVTDITQYDTTDTTKLVWFTVPKNEGKAIWLPPYITDNLDMRVISYNVPVYYKEQFVGVIGIEIDYTTMAEQVQSIKLFSNGYAFVSNPDGKLFYHPLIDVTQLTEDTMPETPEGLISGNTFVRYTFEGVEKAGVWMPLSNGMRMNVAAPVSETEGDWQKLIWNILIAAVLVVAAAILFTMLYTKRIVKPLKQLIEATEKVDKGNYEFTLDYDNDDEVGKLTRTFKLLTDHMQHNIKALNKRVFVDALTRVKNKGAFTSDIDELQTQIDKDDSQKEFAIGVFDCDNLKVINDRFGHDKGDEYLKSACRVICHTFLHSPVYRIGGDEFTVILQNEDYQNREALMSMFEDTVSGINSTAENPWEEVHISYGIADHDLQNDSAVVDVMHRADMIMYQNKHKRKKAQQTIDHPDKNP